MVDENLAGCRVLVVEDEALIALMIEDVLIDAGCEIVGTTGKLETALALARNARPDIAVLDISIRGGKVYPVADHLLTLGIPFVLASGYGEWTLPENLRNRPRLQKPFTKVELQQRVKGLWKQAAGRASPDAT